MPCTASEDAGEVWLGEHATDLLNVDELVQLLDDLGGAIGRARDDHGDARLALHLAVAYCQALHIVAPPRKHPRHLRMSGTILPCKLFLDCCFTISVLSRSAGKQCSALW